MRILGFVTLGFLLISNLVRCFPSSELISLIISRQTIARRVPGTQNLGPLINIAEFKKPAYSFYVAALVINTLTIFSVRSPS